MILMQHNIIISLGLSKRDPACSCEECETVGSVVVCFTSHKSISNHAAFRVCAYETNNRFCNIVICDLHSPTPIKKSKMDVCSSFLGYGLLHFLFCLFFIPQIQKPVAQRLHQEEVIPMGFGAPSL